MHDIHNASSAYYAPAGIKAIGVGAYDAGMAKTARHKTYLREWRKLKPGRTLEQVADQIGISQPQLGRVEKGQQPYNQDLLEALAELYGCAVPDLLMRDPTKPDNIWSLWDRAQPGQRRVIEAAADAILKTGTGD